MAWRWPGDMPLSEPMMVSLLTHTCVTRPQWVNSLALEKCDNNMKSIIFKLITQNDSLGTSWEIELSWVPQNLINEKSALVQVLAWCCQATSHYLSQCWPRYTPPYGIPRPQWVNSSPPSAVYMRQWTGPSLVQIMACRLFSAKPLPESMLVYCQLDPWEQVSVKFESEFYPFHSRKCIWKCLPKMAAILSRGRWVKGCLPPVMGKAVTWL